MLNFAIRPASNPKARLRTAMRRRRAALTAATRRTAGRLAQDTLVGLDEFAAARTVFCYLAVNGEVPTDRLLERCRLDGKTVCVPAFRKRDRRYAPARMRPGTRIVPGRWGIPEPRTRKWVPLGAVDLVIAPGLAFDRRCGRLGHGGGHYDRILRGLKKNAFTVGLAFDFQVVNKVPMTPSDVRLDAVVTEKRVWRVNQPDKGTGGKT